MYLDACPPAVNGCGGHNQTFSLAYALTHGFGLDEEAALVWMRYEIDGVRYQLSGWVLASKKGKKYLSLSTTKLDADGNPIFARKGGAA